MIPIKHILSNLTVLTYDSLKVYIFTYVFRNVPYYHLFRPSPLPLFSILTFYDSDNLHQQKSL